MLRGKLRDRFPCAGRRQRIREDNDPLGTLIGHGLEGALEIGHRSHLPGLKVQFQ